MEFLRDPKIDFLGKRVIFAALSGVMVIGSITLLATRGLQYGIDFRGGADVVLRFSTDPGIDNIRSALAAEGLAGAQIQNLSTAGTIDVHDILVRVPPQEDEAEAGDVSGLVIDTLRRGLGQAEMAGGKVDLNIAGASEIRGGILTIPGSEATAEADAAAITSYRDAHQGIFRDLQEARSIDGLSSQARTWIDEAAVVGNFAIRSADYVGPSVGRELKTRATYAVGGALLAMLVYIWFRFQKLAFGVAAIVTLAHDALIALGAVSLTGKEFDLTVLAAVLAVVGLSINDTIVIFDRVRENTRLHRGGRMEKLFNDSINQTLSRTIITTVLILIVVGTLWLFGGSRLNPFGFTLLVGAIVGTYSTIAVSSPIVVWWRTLVEKKVTA